MTHTEHQPSEIDRHHQHDEVPATYYEDGLHGHWGQRWWHTGRQRIVQRLIAQLPKPRQIVDLGCHSGWLSGQLQQWTGAQVVGLDYGETLLAHGRQHHPNVEFRQADLEQPLPLESASTDWVTAFDVLEHLKTLPETLKESYRVLRPGGLLICAIPGGRLFTVVWWFWTHRRGSVWRDLHEADATPARLQRLAVSAGFKVQRRLRHFVGMYHVFIFRKP